MRFYFSHMRVTNFPGSYLCQVLLCLLPFISNSQESADSLADDKISIKFLRGSQSYEIFSPALNTGELLKSWLWRNGGNYWPEFQLELDRDLHDFKFKRFTDFDKYNSQLTSYPGLDYRGTSNYLPENVREYIDFKMGREPYLPVFNPVILGFIFYNLRHYLLKNQQENSVLAELSLPEVKLLQILLEKYPLDERDWYFYYQQVTQDSLFSVLKFQNAIETLRKKSLVVQQFTKEKELKYFPSSTAPSFYLRSRP
jgi:hypothetical protein